MARKDFINFKDWVISFGPVFKWDWETTLVPCGDGCTKDVIRVEKDPWRQATIKNGESPYVYIQTKKGLI